MEQELLTKNIIFESNGKNNRYSIPLSECKKVYVQRDYSHPMGVKFLNEFLPDLENYVSYLSINYNFKF